MGAPLMPWRTASAAAPTRPPPCPAGVPRPGDVVDSHQAWLTRTEIAAACASERCGGHCLSFANATGCMCDRKCRCKGPTKFAGDRLSAPGGGLRLKAVLRRAPPLQLLANPPPLAGRSLPFWACLRPRSAATRVLCSVPTCPIPQCPDAPSPHACPQTSLAASPDDIRRRRHGCAARCVGVGSADMHISSCGGLAASSLAPRACAHGSPLPAVSSCTPHLAAHGHACVRTHAHGPSNKHSHAHSRCPPPYQPAPAAPSLGTWARAAAASQVRRRPASGAASAHGPPYSPRPPLHPPAWLPQPLPRRPCHPNDAPPSGPLATNARATPGLTTSCGRGPQISLAAGAARRRTTWLAHPAPAQRSASCSAAPPCARCA
jgi:hypothetical protein